MKIYSLVGFEGHAFDGITMKEDKLPKLIAKLDKLKVKIVAIKINKQNIELLVDKPLSNDSTNMVTLKETIIDRVGEVKHHREKK